MKITKRQLRRIIKEACALSGDASGDHMTHIGPQPEVPSPQDYDAVRGFMNTNPDIVDLGISMVMDLVGVSCERSTAQAIIDHLQGMLHGADAAPQDHHGVMMTPEILGTGGV